MIKDHYFTEDYRFIPNFHPGGAYRTRSGKRVVIIDQMRAPHHGHDCVCGDDCIWRYDRPGDIGRVTGQRDPACPDDLLPGAVP